jgi:hypothetical protein
MKKHENKQMKIAQYGHALFSNRGGWTPREMFGADYKRFSSGSKAIVTERDFQGSLETISRRVQFSTEEKQKK